MDPFAKVRSGQKLRIPARAYNSFIDAAQYVANQQANVRTGATPDPLDAGTVIVKNTSTTAAAAFSVLGIDGVVVDEGTRSNQFKFHPVLSCSVPDIATHKGKYVITQEPIPSGKLGRARVAGMSVVQVLINDENHEWAEMVDGDMAKLSSARSGSARILYRPSSGSGTARWSLVRLGEKQRDANDPIECDVWVAIDFSETQNRSVVIDDRDWRGRIVLLTGAYYQRSQDGEPIHGAWTNLKCYANNADLPVWAKVGASYASDYTIHISDELTVGREAIRLYIRGTDGALVLEIGDSGEGSALSMHVHLHIRGSSVRQEYDYAIGSPAGPPT